MRLLLLLCPALAFAGVACMEADNVTPRGTWTLEGKYWGTCAGAANRGSVPIHYVVSNVDDALSTAQSDESALGALLQKVVNDAWYGDALVFTARRIFAVDQFGPHIVRLHGDVTKRFLITGTEEAKLPPVGTRITRAYLPLMPTLEVRGQAVNPGAQHGYPHIYIIGGPPGAAADGIDVHGIHMRFTVRDNPWGWQVGGGVIVHGHTGKGGRSWSTFTSQAEAANSTTVHVVNARGFAVSTPRQKICFGNINNQQPSTSVSQQDYTVEAVDYTLNTIQIQRVLVDPLTAVVTGPDPAGNGLIAPVAEATRIFAPLNRDGDGIWEPKDQIFRQIIVDDPPPLINVNNAINSWVQGFTLRDSYLEAITIGTGAEEYHIMGFSSAEGPHLFENNMFTSGMAVMYGGSFDNTNSHLQFGSIWRYNYFTDPLEMSNLGQSGTDQWLSTQDNGSTADCSKTPCNQWGFYAMQSVAGLAPHSPRFVRAGRGILLNVLKPPQYYAWIAQNTGVVGTTHPNFPAVTTDGIYVYDGDPMRLHAPGCPEAGCKTVCNGTTYDGDGVCWRQRYGVYPYKTSKNLWELKNGSKVLLEYNVFDGFADTLEYNTSQNAMINIKGAGAYFGMTAALDDHPAVYGLPYAGNATCTGDKLGGKPARPIPCCTGPGTGTCVPFTYNSTATTVTGCWYNLATFPKPYVSADGLTLEAGYSPWPYCSRAAEFDITIQNNIIRNSAGGIYTPGSGYSSGYRHRGWRRGDMLIQNNLFQIFPPLANIRVYNPFFCMQIQGNGDERSGSEIPSGSRIENPSANIQFVRNTCYMPWLYTKVPSAPFGLKGSASSEPIYPGALFTANILARGKTGTFSWGGTNMSEAGFGVKDWPQTSRNGLGAWGKNIILGAAAASTTQGAYPPGSVWTGCLGTAADGSSNNAKPCMAGAAVNPTAPDFAQVLVNPSAGDYRIRDDFAWGKRGYEGRDLGADPNQLPMIQELRVTPSDRAVLFTWRLTPPILDVPCVIELHTAPDLETTNYGGAATGYAAELSDIATYHGQDADNGDRNYRDGNRRMITLGYAVHLHPGTPYYYRLQCGGDTQMGMFTTLAALSGLAVQIVARTTAAAGVSKMAVEYGTSYSRNADTISDGGTAAADCSEGQHCVVRIPATRGSVLYYRWSELGGDDSILLAGRVEAMVAQ